MKNNWITSGNFYALKEVSQQLNALPVAIYRMNEDQMTKEIYLTQVQERFDFSYKVYGIERPLINRIVKTYQHTSGNLGILLNGTKGTGKTVTGRILCNELKMPVIIIPESFGKIPSFLNEIQQEVIVFVDEYEKIYQDYDGKGLLTVMDGVMNSDYRRVFLLTTNRLTVNDNLLQRPGRIRYVKTFGDLPLQSIIEVVDDVLIHPAHREEAIEYIASLECITIDIVKSVVEEINIHNESPFVFADVFNTKQNGDKYNVYEIAYGQEPKILYREVQCTPSPVTQDHKQWDFYINRKEVGEIAQVHSDSTFTIAMIGDDDDAPRESKELKTLRLEQIKSLHREFWQYAF